MVVPDDDREPSGLVNNAGINVSPLTAGTTRLYGVGDSASPRFELPTRKAVLASSAAWRQPPGRRRVVAGEAREQVAVDIDVSRVV
jgi:hypothetical protein